MSEMFITPIQPWELEINRTTSTERASSAGQNGISVFKDVFANAINDVKASEDALAKEQYLLATGQTDNPHAEPIAAAKAQLAVDLLVALRSTAMQSYSEIMRISA
ncbi:MAG: flagellar hook-basal body complex protein FliE [Coprococcus sp.]|nr:flagellar hook-basal body complex protein FliE [Coprococcus sp.]